MSGGAGGFRRAIVYQRKTGTGPVVSSTPDVVGLGEILREKGKIVGFRRFQDNPRA